MIINYNVSGSDRKQLVAAIAEHTGEKAKYLGAPGFAYQIGGFTVSVDGKVTIEDNSTAASLIRFLSFLPRVCARSSLPRLVRRAFCPSPARTFTQAPESRFT